LRLRGLEETTILGTPPYAPPDAIWAATALTGAGLRLVSPRGGSGTLLTARSLPALSSGLHEIHATGGLSVDLQMTLGSVGLLLETRFADGFPQALISWLHSPGILVIGDELARLGDVAELARDFAREFRVYPRLDYWANEASAIPCVEVLEARTGIPLPRRKPRPKHARATLAA
jgi:hypothetical protein